MSDPQPTAERQVRIRRGPKVIRFVAVGAGLGAIAAFIDVQVTPEDANYSTAQALGFIALVLVPIGAALGAALAVLLDRSSIRRSRIVTAERIRARTTRQGEAEAEPQTGRTGPAGPAQDGEVDRSP